MKLPVGISDFQKLVEGKYQLVDKSLFIKEIMNDSAEVILITRPRRFGKTLNISMLYHFLQMNFFQDSDLFEGLAISKDMEFCKKYQHQYPVIFITFKGVKQSNYTIAYDFITDLVSQLYEAHRYLLAGELLSAEEKIIFTRILKQEANMAQISTSIKRLSQYMTRKFNKQTIILIDEYDTPIQEAYLKGYYEDMIELMRSILGEALKDNISLAKAVLTGITRISQESMFSGLNNIKVFSLLREEYGRYFGFTEDEVHKLIAETGKEVELNAIKEWYNGYQIGKHILYNPWSIINCLDSNGKLEPYWLNTSTNDLIGKLLSNAPLDVKHQLEDLLQGKEVEQALSENLVFTELEQREDALWSLFLYAGYLKVLSSELVGSRLMAKIAIPNREVRLVYDRVVENWFSTGSRLASYDKFVASLNNADIDGFKTYLSSYLLHSSSYFDFNEKTVEQIFHVFILGLVVGLRDHYYIYSNRESGLGRFDITLLPHDKKRKGILLEFKTAEAAELLMERAQVALQQIRDKQYVEAFKQHNVSTVLAVGLAFCGKQVELAYEELHLE